MLGDRIEKDIQGYDIDGEVIRAARENARLAGVDHLIHFQKRSVSELNHPKKYDDAASAASLAKKLAA